MKKEEFSFISADNSTKIKAVKYLPEKDVVAILQIAHGMVEFIDRYDDFAKFLCDKGLLVVGNDHLGHGASVKSQEDWGYFAESDGYKVVLKDMHTLMELTKKEYPDKPYFLLGHSMGSFFCRLFLCEYPKELNGAIVMGTGQQSVATVRAGKVLARAIAARKGYHHRSQTVNAIALGSYNKKWEPSQTHCDWLTKDEEIVKWYSNEPRCQFTFTLNGYYNLFDCIEQIIKPSNIFKMDKDTPVLIVSGEDDPVGEFGKGPKEVYEAFTNIGIKDLQLKLYPNDRHEILNELDKLDVYNDLFNWIKERI